MIINGVKYAIEIHQDDASLPCLFMLHGFMGDRRVFDHMTEILCDACNPVTVDLLGHGKSEKVYNPDRYVEKQQIDDILEIVKQTAARFNNRTISDVSSFSNASGCANSRSREDTSKGANAALPFLYGYSMGGRLALKTALRAPEAFAGLILESTNYGITGEAERAGRRKADARRARQIMKDYPSFLAEWEALPLFGSPIKTDKELENRYKEIHLAQDPQAMAASLQGFSTGAMQPVRNAITCYKNPVITVAGTGDQKYMKISQLLASSFSHAHFCPISAGHRVHMDNPAALIEKSTHFIRDLGKIN